MSCKNELFIFDLFTVNDGNNSNNTNYLIEDVREVATKTKQFSETMNTSQILSCTFTKQHN